MAAVLTAAVSVGTAACQRGSAPAPAQTAPAAAQPSAPAGDPLPSWNDGAAKKAILDFVAKVTKEGGPDFVPVAERIATFDNDGTLWCEQPMYFQLAFALDRVKALAPKHPEWKDEAAVQGGPRGDMKASLAERREGLVELIAATHAGMTTDEFETIVKRLARDRPSIRGSSGRTPSSSTSRCSSCSPTCGPTASRRSSSPAAASSSCAPWTEQVYGIPPEQVVGSTHQDEVRAARR